MLVALKTRSTTMADNSKQSERTLEQREADWAEAATLAKTGLVNTNSIAVDAFCFRGNSWLAVLTLSTSAGTRTRGRLASGCKGVEEPVNIAWVAGRELCRPIVI